ncbi:hypothetical protein E2320_004288, partial [Naja naja]
MLFSKNSNAESR